MAIEKFKDVKIKNDAGVEYEFRIPRVTAAIGSWIAQQMLLKTITQPPIYEKVRDHLFAGVLLLKGQEKTPVAIYQVDAQRFTVPELELELDLYFYENLFTACLDFNFDSFFAKRRADEKARREAEGTQTTLS